MSDLYDNLPFCEYHAPIIEKNEAKRKKYNKNNRSSSSSTEWPRKQIYQKEWAKIDQKIDSRIQSLFEQFLCDFVKTEVIDRDQSLDLKKIPTTIITLSKYTNIM
ncbi:hypothetical protein BLA29_006829 [Euroglyphus maynei]|uniref:Uncharacterized protein n=1 Tax=Euroglyphus maynei TaxID=6958 RepID=A0A1Y3BR73_EURMA|nr:hypothetical protein BLA29_006829 [Euroglyphus maynei]